MQKISKKAVIAGLVLVMVLLVALSTLIFTFSTGVENNVAIKILEDKEFEILNAQVEDKFPSSVRVRKTNTTNEKKKYDYTILYDIKDCPKFVLYEDTIGGYFIMVRETETLYERNQEGHSPYYGLKGKMYYNGFGNYYIKNGNTIKNISTNEDMTEMFGECPNIIEQAVESQKAITEEEVIETKGSNVVKMADGDSVTGETRWGAYDTYSSGKANTYFSSLNGSIYSSEANDLSGVEYDRPHPYNNDNGCALVALVMAMQYYERNGIKKTIPSAFTNGQTFGVVYLNGKNWKAADYRWSEGDETDSKFPGFYYPKYEPENPHDKDARFLFLSDLIEYIIDNDYRGNAKTAVTSDGIKNAYTKFCNNYASGTQALSLDINVFYNNMVAAISGGNIAIGQTSAGNGYYQNGGWRKYGLGSHQMVTYGYCTNAKGTLQDFICHSGWFVAGTQKMYVYKTNFVRNVTISVN